jgi:hypothetical protein
MLSRATHIGRRVGTFSKFRESLRWCVLALAALSAGSACAQSPKVAEVADDDPDVRELPDAVRDVLKQSGVSSAPSAVFVVNKDGTVVSLTDKRPFPDGKTVRFPRRNDEFDWTQSISIFKYKNPSTCIMIGTKQKCF